MLTKITSAVTAVLDSTAFKIFFAVWTGIYLVQVIKKETGGPDVSELSWIIWSFAVALFFI